VKVADTSLGNAFTSYIVGGTTKNHTVPDVASHLPHVARVGFAYINNVKRHFLPVLLIQLVERGNLPAKWRSSIAAENEYDRFVASEGREPD